MTIDDQLFAAARTGDVTTLDTLLDAHPEKLHVRAEPYGWSLLHLAAHGGHLAAVDTLLRRGLDVNTREQGDNSCAIHWAAAAGHLDVVRRLADVGGDVVGDGDEHGLQVIGWAACWEKSDDAKQRAVVDFLIERGAQHHIFSAVAMNLGDEVRRIVASNPEALSMPMSPFEDGRLPLHLAAMKNRPEMVALLLELGADPLATDDTGANAAAYATAPEIARLMSDAIISRGGKMDLLTALSLSDWDAATGILAETPDAIDKSQGVLHLMAKRNNIAAARWLLERGADPNGIWRYFDADVTPLHIAAGYGHAEMVRLLLDSGADRTIRDSKYDGDAAGWADHFEQKEIVRLLEGSE